MKDLQTIIAYFRGQPGVSLKQALQALLNVLAAAVGVIPDDATPEILSTVPTGASAVTDEHAAIAYLEEMVATHEKQHKGKGGQKTAAAFSFPAWLIPLLTSLLQKWLSGKSNPAPA